MNFTVSKCKESETHTESTGCYVKNTSECGWWGTARRDTNYETMTIIQAKKMVAKARVVAVKVVKCVCIQDMV